MSSIAPEGTGVSTTLWTIESIVMGDINMKKSTNRPQSSLSSSEVRRTANNVSSYGAQSETVTRNTGLILTDYMMKSITITKLKEDAEIAPKHTEEEKRKAEALKKKEEIQNMLDSVFEEYSHAHESYSSFGFLNESNGLAAPTDSPSLGSSSSSNSSSRSMSPIKQIR